jgi:hypothetical protein
MHCCGCAAHLFRSRCWHHAGRTRERNDGFRLLPTVNAPLSLSILPQNAATSVTRLCHSIMVLMIKSAESHMKVSVIEEIGNIVRESIRTHCGSVDVGLYYWMSKGLRKYSSNKFKLTEELPDKKTK